MDDESIACFGGSIHQLGRDMRYNGELSGVFSIPMPALYTFSIKHQKILQEKEIRIFNADQ